MKIILKANLNDNIVEFESNLGYGAATWENNKLPILNNSYNIELDIDDFFEWEKNITLEKRSESSIHLFDNKIFFSAKVISCEGNGVWVLSFGNDIVLIEASGTCEINKFICFFTIPDNVRLYPIEL
ncbi:hypothetical protein ABX014_22965 [Snodgrassella alvi]|uniref:hypothetical protein n=1 Tax=Snodgrassella alvi TaxID=1196083 RepID=UPI00351C2091